MTKFVSGTKYVAEKVGEDEYRRFAQRPDWLTEDEWFPIGEVISRAVQSYVNESDWARRQIEWLPSHQIDDWE